MALLELLPRAATLPNFILLIAAIIAYKYITAGHITKSTRDDPNAPVSVNYFPSRKCNYTCGFCFHTDTSSFVLSLDEAKCGLRLLKEAGMRKLNIAGGEPFLYPLFLAEILRYCKVDLGVESVSIISNGSKIHKKWMQPCSGWV